MANLSRCYIRILQTPSPRAAHPPHPKQHLPGPNILERTEIVHQSRAMRVRQGPELSKLKYGK